MTDESKVCNESHTTQLASRNVSHGIRGAYVFRESLEAVDQG